MARAGDGGLECEANQLFADSQIRNSRRMIDVLDG
jgi:hypothetical protein